MRLASSTATTVAASAAAAAAIEDDDFQQENHTHVRKHPMLSTLGRLKVLCLLLPHFFPLYNFFLGFPNVLYLPAVLPGPYFRKVHVRCLLTH